MASGLLALLDDIAAIMDDVAVASKIAAKKTSAILGDDIAVTAKQSSGFVSSREIPVIIAITKGSFINKAIIMPIVFILNYFAPWFIVPVLMLGGLYLAYEGMEKIFEFIFHRKEPHKRKKLSEKEKIKSAIKTDFILSLEIIIIALASVKDQPFVVQLISTIFVAILTTVGVYGLVALIVKMDDLGFWLIETGVSVLQKIGRFLVILLPWVIKGLSVIGTIAMLLVAGGIYIHNLEILHHYLHPLPLLVSELLIGAVLGSIVFAFVKLIEKLKPHHQEAS